jgi:predicted transcriptional regulator
MKTSVYLDEDQKSRLDEVATLSGRSQADLIREGVNQVIHNHLRTRPAMTARVREPGLVGRTQSLLADLGSE